MPYFKDTNNTLHFLEDASFIHLLPAGCVEIPDEEAEELRNSPETPEQTIARLESAIDRHLDAQANLYRYNSIRTMVTYENDPNPKFHSEGLGAKAFRSACYTLGIQLIEDVTNEVLAIPTESELITLLPKLEDFVVY